MGFSASLIKWYKKNKRDLPFRRTKDPYRIWISEVILQQTRVSQGLPYYEKFIKLFPTLGHLAGAGEDKVLKAWQGLGYYSRARNLHHAAKHISNVLGGKFPVEFEEIKKLKGIGDYTAGAIASLAFNKPHAVVDGNVYRVLSRYFGIHTPIDSTEGKKEFRRRAEALLYRKDPGTYNQAVMEFGALQCVPVQPDCSICPLKSSCAARSKNMVEILPVKSKKTKAHIRHFNYFIFRKGEKILVRKRTGNDIWKNLYDFPMIETTRPVSRKQLEKRISMSLHPAAIPLKHLLSHQTITARFWKVMNGKKQSQFLIKGCFYVGGNQLNKLAVPRLIDLYLKKYLRSR